MVVAHLERTRDAFVAATQGLSAAQYRFSPEPGRWSIADIVEHVALVELRTLDMLANKLPQAPPPSDGKVTGAARFARLDTSIPTRDQRRITAPEALVPKGTWPDADASMAAFLEARARSVAAAAAVDAETLAHVVPHRLLGEFDAEEWLYFTAVHLTRHTAQIEEIKRDAGFPGA